MSDPVNHPAHYTDTDARCTCGAPIECIQVTEHFDFCTGNAIKYLWRHMKKRNPVEDLRKARWYIDRRIQQLEGGSVEAVFEGDEFPGPPACAGGGCGED